MCAFSVYLCSLVKKTFVFAEHNHYFFKITEFAGFRCRVVRWDTSKDVPGDVVWDLAVFRLVDKFTKCGAIGFNHIPEI